MYTYIYIYFLIYFLFHWSINYNTYGSFYFVALTPAGPACQPTPKFKRPWTYKKTVVQKCHTPFRIAFVFVDSHCNSNIAVAFQKTYVFSEKMYVWSLTNFKQVISPPTKKLTKLNIWNFEHLTHRTWKKWNLKMINS